MTTESIADFDRQLRQVFGVDISTSPLSTDERMGRRVHGVDLTQSLTPAQAKLIVGLLDHYTLCLSPPRISQASAQVI